MSEDPLVLAWETVLTRWEEDAPHAAFIELAAQLDRLADAGASYREVRESDPERAERAALMIDRIIARAVATMDFRRPERDAGTTRTRRALIVLALVVATLLIGSAYVAAMRLASSAIGDPSLVP